MSIDAIRYQVLTPQYVESAIKCSIICKASQINTYTEFQIPLEYIEESVRAYYSNKLAYKFTIIAIDELVGNKVVGVIQGMDMMDYEQLIVQESSHPRLNSLAKLSRRLTEGPRNSIKNYGECIYANSIDILSEYKNKSINSYLMKFFFLRCFDHGYKQYISQIYNPQMFNVLNLMNKHRVQVICSLNPDDCLDIDPKIKDYFNRKFISIRYFTDENSTQSRRQTQQKKNFDQIRPNL